MTSAPTLDQVDDFIVQNIRSGETKSFDGYLDSLPPRGYRYAIEFDNAYD
ncbi:MAG: hypothetical protein AAGA92_14105 [Planctomycetota bacterium]